MNIYCVNISKIISFIFIICLLIPNISFSNSQVSENHQVRTPATIQQPIDTSADSERTPKEREILSGDRELGPFFVIGLIINLVMITTFALWAIGQWRQNDKKKK